MPPAGWLQRLLREYLGIGKTDITLLTNEFAKPVFSKHLPFRDQSRHQSGISPLDELARFSVRA